MARAAAIVLPVLALGCLVVSSLLELDGMAVDSTSVFISASGVLYVGVGAVVVWRQPRQRVAWLLVAIGILTTTGRLAEQVALAEFARGVDLPLATLALWYVQWWWIPYVFSMLVGIPLLFPTGRPSSRGWARFGWVVAGLALLYTIGGMFGQQLMLDFPEVAPITSFDSPVGILPISDIEAPSLVPFLAIPMQGGCLIALASLVQRYRRSHGAERQQMKWGVLGLAVSLGAFLAGTFADVVLGRDFPVLEGVATTVAPVAIGLAIARYRLWDVDRLISRTVAYLGVSGVLGVGYAVLVVAVQGVGGGGDLPDLVVAAATLVAAAVFQPLRRRIQTGVDRHFHRARYDAATELDRFGEVLRDEVDVAVVTARMRELVDRTLDPALATVWLPREERA